MSDSSSARSGGIGFFSLLTVLFIGLKLANVIDWNWFWVLSPFLLPIIIGVGLGIVLMIVNKVR